jgi:3-dehydroquinate synthetase
VDAERVEAHLKNVGLPTRLGDVPGGPGTVDEILDAMAQDKKVKGGALTFILARGLGRSFVAPGVAVDDVRSFLRGESNALS